VARDARLERQIDALFPFEPLRSTMVSGATWMERGAETPNSVTARTS
jgi:hypothetical protein